MRDNLRNEDYYITLIEREKKNIEMFENALAKTIVEKGESDTGVRNAYNILVNSYQKMINLLYSCGEKLSLIEGYFIKLLYYYCKMWDRKYGYFELVKVLSLAVLFEVDKAALLELEKKLMVENFNDYLVNILVHEVNSLWKNSGEEFEFIHTYEYLKTIIESTELQCEKLQKYLSEEWYDIHKECAWYNSHKSSQNFYYGFWSFEAGAIAKILKLDDSSLKDVPYYPYDLVRYGTRVEC